VKSSSSLGVVLPLILVLAAFPCRSAERQFLHGHVPSAVNHLPPIQRLSQDARLDLAIGLQLRNREELTNLLHDLYDPASPRFHRYLTPEQFAERFGPTEADYENAKAFARAHGLTITGVHPNRTLLDVSGAAADVEKTFHVNLRLYRHPTEARLFRAPDVEPWVELSVPLSGVSGLDDFVQPKPMNQGPGGFKARADITALDMAWTTGSGPEGEFIGQDFRAAYAPGVALNGAGQAVGLFELDSCYPTDITAYEILAGLPQVAISNVFVGTANMSPGIHNTEVALDIDMAMDMAPGAQVLVYQGHVANDVLNRMATDNLARQLSSSWSFGQTVDAVRDQIFQQFQVQGQTMFQASGDAGAYAGAAIAPSDNPYITVVGGTVLATTGPHGAWISETTWPHSSGGSSTAYPVPIWQQGLNTSTNQGSATNRNFPDVAAMADATIWLVANHGQEGTIGGTSASAPLWAGFMALVNQQAALSGLPSVGFANPRIYSLARGPNYRNLFHDVTIGSNTNLNSPGRFFATPGYDLCTGWGTPTGSNLINALASPPMPLQISPATNLVFTGPAGGPFAPTNFAFLLTNTTAAQLNWSVVKTGSATWLNVGATGGTLTSGGPATTVTLSPNTSAGTLPPGVYVATLWFTNLVDLSAQSRQVTLDVVSPPIIILQPGNQAVIEGTTATFSVGTTNQGPLFYQWRYDSGAGPTNLMDGGHISGASSPTLTVNNVSQSDVGAYSVVVSNAAGAVTSSNAFLGLVPWRAMITTQPLSQTLLPGETLTLSATAAGTPPLTFQWQQNGTNLNDGGNASGATTPTLTITNVSAASSGIYSVIVSNSLGTDTGTATVTILSNAAAGNDLTSVYSFSGGGDGGNPNGLLSGSDGKLYGTTANGGTNGAGSVFQLATNGAFAGLHSFGGGADGQSPFAPLVGAPDGNFYGTTLQGGVNDDGTVFKITPAGVLTTLASFAITNGDLPFGGLAFGMDGNFYGTTHQGGSSGRGTVFKLTTNGVLTTLYSFTGGADGGFPYGGVVQGPDGILYGTTFLGGASSAGTVFSVTTNGLFASLFSFGGTNGTFPFGGLALGDDGTFYGTTTQGGASNNGTAFRITSAGVVSNLYSFTGGPEGSGPEATLTEASDGNFYGTAAYGGAFGDGTVFRLSPDGTVTTLASFDGFDGMNPQAPLTQAMDGNLYGATPYGGTAGEGAIFRVGISGAPQITTQPSSQSAFLGATVRISVACYGSPQLKFYWQKDGNNLSDGGNVSGTTTHALLLQNVSPTNAGNYWVTISNALGFVTSTTATLQVTSSPPVIVLGPTNQTVSPGATAVFHVSAIGNLPLAYQWRRNGTNLNDTGNLSGTFSDTLVLTNVVETNNGAFDVVVGNSVSSVASTGAVLTVIPVSIAGTRLSTLHAFTGGGDGGTPNALMRSTNGNLYGTTKFGGSAHLGSVFSLTTNGVLTTLHSFTGVTDGALPLSALVQGTNGLFYGTTETGGSNSEGTVFQMAADGTLGNLYAFDAESDGANPYAALVQGADGNLYGSAQGAGDFGNGDLFKITPQGTLMPLYAFTNGADGGFPVGAMVLASDGNFYGTVGGGASGFGLVYRLSPQGAFSTVYSFRGGADGYAPAGALVQGSDGNLYGTTTHNVIGRFQFYGTIYRLTTNGALTTLYALNFSDGNYPFAGLIQGSDGNLYGTTYQGGAQGNGTVFRITPDGTFTSLLSFDGFNDGALPADALVEGPDGNLYGTTTSGGPGGKGTIFRLAMTAAPQITSQPAGQTVFPGTNVSFSVAAFGAPRLGYQWRLNGVNLVDGGTYSGAKQRILNVSAAATNSGAYSVVVSNSLGFATSATATLTVKTAPVFQTLQRSNNTFRVTWSSAAGLKYQLQSKSSLSAVNWTNVGSAVTANGSTATASDTIGPNTQRFYRVVLLP